jgi:hypothetical protein
MSAHTLVAFACVALGLPTGAADLARQGVLQAWTLASTTWRRYRWPHRPAA